MMPPPHARDGFKTDSTPFLPHSLFLAGSTCSCECCKRKSITHLFFSVWPPVAVNIVYFLIHVIERWGGGYRKNTRGRSTSYRYRSDNITLRYILISSAYSVCNSHYLTVVTA